MPASQHKINSTRVVTCVKRGWREWYSREFRVEVARGGDGLGRSGQGGSMCAERSMTAPSMTTQIETVALQSSRTTTDVQEQALTFETSSSCDVMCVEHSEQQ